MRKLKLTTEEGFPVEFVMRDFEEMHGVTLCCVIMNEEKNIKDFLLYYKPYVKNIVMIDGGSNDRTVELASLIADDIIIRKFDGHYSNQANRVIEAAKTDWVLLVDCDERIEKPFLESLSSAIDQEEYDCFAFPRKNFIDGKFDEIHYPDYQDRLFRSYCRRIRPVHGEVVGYKKRKELPCIDGNFMIHSKPSERHIARNKMYVYYEVTFKNEISEPGCQTKESFEKKYPLLCEHNFMQSESAILTRQ